jgi:serine/threonine-protein kinase
LTSENTERLLDFGIAHINVPQSPGQTLAGVSMGTPAFMPPEQASAHWDKVDAQSDVWAVGASMFTLLTGRYVHQGSTVNESLVLAVTKPAPKVEQINPKLPKPICTIVNKALERDKSRRYQSASDMQLHVRQVFHQLQGDVPEEERYSLSDGLVAKHSLPPRALNVEWPDTESIQGGQSPLPPGIVDPVAAAAFAADRITLEDAGPDSELDRKSFRPSPDKRWLIGGAAVVVVVALGILLGSQSDEPPSGEASAAQQTQAPAAASSPEVAQPVTEPTPSAEPEAAEPETSPAAEEAVQPEKGPSTGVNPAARRVGRPVLARPGSGGGKTAPAGEAKADEEFDPFAERE